MAFVFGPAKISELKSEFNLTESIASKILIVL
jgi:hypothetical protein